MPDDEIDMLLQLMVIFEQIRSARFTIESQQHSERIEQRWNEPRSEVRMNHADPFELSNGQAYLIRPCFGGVDG